MANYLPVLLVSVSTNASIIPDDSSLSTLPRAQVDYLSHNWEEEDVWRSWRNMTKQKNEIANGMRLENASWRTWWKQRNKLKTVSPETLNWLKDSDVTWLYGPLHTAVDWNPPPKPKPDPTSVGKDNTPQDRLDLSISAKKPILKHRSISEMLTSDLPAPLFSPAISESVDEEGDGDELEDIMEENESGDGGWTEGLPPSPGGRGSKGKRRPSLLHTKSDSHVTKWGPSRAFRKDSPPRVIAAEPGSSNTSTPLLEEAGSAASASSSTTPTPHAYMRKTSSRRGSNSNVAGGYFDGVHLGGGDSSSALSGLSPRHDTPPSAKKKHISFNTFVEQCIAIEQPKPRAFGGYDDEEEEEEGPCEATTWTPPSESDSEEEEEEEDDFVEMRPSFKPRSKSKGSHSSTSSASTSGSSSSSSASSGRLYPYPHRRTAPGGRAGLRDRPPLIRTASNDKEGTNNVKEHVTIAPIAPTILKTIGVGDEYDLSSPTHPHVWSDGLGDEYSDDACNLTLDPNRWQGVRRARERDRERERERERERTRGHGSGVPPEVELVYVPPLGSNYQVPVESDEMYLHQEAWFTGGRRAPPTPPTRSSRTPNSSSFEPSPAFMDHPVADDAYDYFAGPDLGEDFAVNLGPSLSGRRKRERPGSNRSSSPIGQVASPSVGNAPELVISGDTSEQRGRSSSRSRSRSRSKSYSRTPSRTPSPTELALMAGQRQGHSAAVAVPGASERASRHGGRNTPEIESSLLSPPPRGRSFLPTSSSTGSLQGGEARGRSISRTRSSSSFSDRSPGSPLGSLSPDGSSLGIAVGSIGGVYAGGRIMERERGRSVFVPDRGRDPTGRIRDSLSPDVISSSTSSPSSSPRSPLAQEVVTRRSSDSRRASSSSTTTVMPSDLRPNGTGPDTPTAPSIPQPSVTHASSKEERKDEEAARSSQPTPSNSPVRRLSNSTTPTSNPSSGPPTPTTANQTTPTSTPPTTKSSPSKSVPHTHPPIFAVNQRRSSDPTTSVSKASPGRVETSTSSPVTESHEESGGTIVGRAVGIVSSAGAFLGLWHGQQS